MELLLPGDLLVQLDEGRGWLLAAVLGLAVILCWAGGRQRKQVRAAAMMAALEGSTRGRVTPYRGPDARGFVVTVSPAPDPFREFSVSYRAVSILDPVDLVRRLAGGGPAQLQVWAILPAPPSAEIVWARGRPPGRALGRRPGHGLWVHHRLELSGSEYATRGANTNALRHAFVDLHARFGSLLQRVIIQREGGPQVELVAAGTGLDPGDLPALLAGLRAAGRAALNK